MNFFLFALQTSGMSLRGVLKKQIAHEFEVFSANFARSKAEPALLGDVGAKCPGEPLSPLVAHLIVEVTALRARVAFLEAAAGISYEKDATPEPRADVEEEDPEDHVPCRDCGHVSCTCVVFSDDDEGADEEANHV